MKNPNAEGNPKLVLKAVILGGASLGTLTILAIICSRWFWKSGKFSIFDYLLTFMSMPTFFLIGGMNGASEFETGVICVIINSLIGAIVFPILAGIWLFFVKGKNEK